MERPPDTASPPQVGVRPAWARRRLVLAFLLVLAGACAVLLLVETSQALPQSGANADMTKLCVDNGAGSGLDKTTEANNVAPSDFSLGNSNLPADSTAVYWGMDYVFNKIYVDVGTAGTTGTTTWKYWNGATWQTFSVTDNTDSFKNSGQNTVSFTPPSDWATTEIHATNCPGARYYLKTISGAAYTVAPLGSQTSTIEFNLRIKVQNELGTAITGLSTVMFSAANGSRSSVFDSIEVALGTWTPGSTGEYLLALEATGGDTTYDIKVQTPGYVKSGNLPTPALSHALTDLTGTPLSLLFNLKLRVNDELGTGISGLAQAAFGVANGTDNTLLTFGSSGATYYLGLSLVGDNDFDVKVTQDGYVTSANLATGTLTPNSQTDKTGTPMTLSSTLKVKVQDELGAAVGGLLQAAFTVSGGTDNTIVRFGETATAGVYVLALKTTLADASYDVQAAKDGYVTSANLATGTLVATSQMDKTGTPLSLSFAYKVTGVTSDGGLVSSATVRAGDGFATTCTESAGAWYCPVPLANSALAIQVEKDGYVTHTASSFGSDRTAATDAQVTGSVAYVRFAYVVASPIVTDANGALSGGSVTVRTGDAASITCTYANIGGAAGYHCPVPIAHTTLTIQLEKDGYVTDTSNSFSTDRTAHTDATVSKSISGFKNAHKVTGITDEIGGTLATVTVKSGDAYATSCTDYLGAWYCAVPLAHTGISIQVSKDGYVTDTGTSFGSDRTAATDAQVTTSVSGVKFAYKVNVDSEINNGVWPGSGEVRVGDAYGVSCSGLVNTAYCAVPISHTTLGIKVQVDGYVTDTANSFSTDRTGNADAQVVASVGGILYGYKVTGITTETGSALTAVTVKAGNNQGVTCTESGGAWYCRVPVSDGTLTISAAKDGYVTNTATSFPSDRTQGTDAQVTASVASVLFAYKITSITSEIGTNVVPQTTPKAGNGYAISCTQSGSAWYCAVPLADTDLKTAVTSDGYVTSTTDGDGVFPSDRTAATDAQVTTAISNIRFGVKITGVTTELNGALTGATVTTGNSYGTTCTENGGAWYCPVPRNDVDTNVQAAKDGYVTQTVANAYVDRTAHGDAQKTASVTGVQFAYKVTGITTEGPANALNAATVSTGNTYGTTCTASGGAYYCAAPLADTEIAIRVAQDGYVTNAGASFPSDRTAATDSQRTASVAGVLFALKVTVTSEADLSGVTFDKSIGGGAFSSVTPAGTSVNIAYFAQTPSEASVQYRGTKGAAQGTTDIFTTSASVQTARDLALVAPLTALSTTAGNYSTGSVTPYTFAFTIGQTWPANGRVVVTFPSGYGLPGSTSVTLTGATGTASAAFSGQAVTVTRANDGAATASSTAVTVALSGITNPPGDGSSGTFSVALQDSTGVGLGSGTSPAVSIITNALSVTGLTSTSHAANAWTSATTLLVTWNAPADTTTNCYSWSLDATPDDVCDGTARSASVPAVADGTHTFRVKARNAVATWGPAASYGGVSVDTAAPTGLAIASGSFPSNACASSSTGSLTWGATDALSGLDASLPYAYGLDGAALARTSQSSTTFTGLADGTHTLAAAAYDRAGNAASASYTFKVDRTAPTATLSVAAFTNAAKAAVSWSASDACSGLAAISVEARFASGSWEAVASPAASGASASGSIEYPFSGGDGTYEFRAKARDALGNEGAWPAAAQASTTRDRVAPGAPGPVDAKAEAGGRVRVTWAAATDDRSGVAGYNVYRAGPDGAWARASLSLVASLEFVDGPMADGSTWRYSARAVDRAGNEGLAVEADRSVAALARGPPSAPTGLRAVGVQDGLLRDAGIRLEWDPVDGAHDYAIYAGPASGVAIVPANRVGTAALAAWDHPRPTDGSQGFAVVARDSAGNEGPGAAVSFTRDSEPATSRASAPAESGPALVVSWTGSDSGAGVAAVRVWVLEPGQDAVLLYTGRTASGDVGFYGVEGRTYRFTAVAEDAAGHIEAKSLAWEAGEATTRITSDVSRVSPASSGRSGGGSDSYYARDANRDGFPEVFVDPEGRLSPLRVVPVGPGRLGYALRGGGDAQGPPSTLWDPASDTVYPVTQLQPLEGSVVEPLEGGRLALRFAVEEKKGWIYVELPDPSPRRPIERVVRVDGTQVTPGHYWRIDGRIVVMDDPTYEYVVIFGRLPAWWGLWPWLVVPLGVIASTLGWIHAPGAARLAAAAPSRRSLAWSLRHCGACGHALARRHRLFRFAHACPGLGERLHEEEVRWRVASFGGKVRSVRRMLRAAPWLLRPTWRQQPPPRPRDYAEVLQPEEHKAEPDPRPPTSSDLAQSSEPRTGPAGARRSRRRSGP